MDKENRALPTNCPGQNFLAADLEYIFSRTRGLWEELRGRKIFITGGTGFFGCWFLESFVYINESLNLGASICVLTRDKERFAQKMPHLALKPYIYFHRGDVRNFNFPKDKYQYIIHAAATSALATFNNEDPLVKFDTVVGGTRHILDFAAFCGAQKFLLTSSGVVYGSQPDNIEKMVESLNVAPDISNAGSVWGESKRVAEFLSTYYAKKYNFENKIARCFSFVGPFLPLNIHYAVGNFINDALLGRPICVKSDGTPRRSYLYMADLMIWLWTIFFKGAAGRPYNVGSQNSISILDLANLVSKIFDNQIPVEVIGKINTGGTAERYVPDTSRAFRELGLTEGFALEESIKKTITHIKANKQLYF